MSLFELLLLFQCRQLLLFPDPVLLGFPGLLLQALLTLRFLLFSALAQVVQQQVQLG